jgi:hypothetical protein
MAVYQRCIDSDIFLSVDLSGIAMRINLVYLHLKDLSIF